MSVIKTIGIKIWELLEAMGRARAERDLMQMRAIRKHNLGR